MVNEIMYLPYSGKFSWDKIFTGGSKHEDSPIKFSQMLAHRAELEHNHA